MIEVFWKPYCILNYCHVLHAGAYSSASQQDYFWFKQKHLVNFSGWWTVFYSRRWSERLRGGETDQRLICSGTNMTDEIYRVKTGLPRIFECLESKLLKGVELMVAVGGLCESIQPQLLLHHPSCNRLQIKRSVFDGLVFSSIRKKKADLCSFFGSVFIWVILMFSFGCSLSLEVDHHNSPKPKIMSTRCRKAKE